MADKHDGESVGIIKLVLSAYLGAVCLCKPCRNTIRNSGLSFGQHVSHVLRVCGCDTQEDEVVSCE